MTQSDSYHKKWAILYSIYKQTSRGGLVKSLHKGLPFSQSWPYKITLLIYVALSIGIFVLTFAKPIALLLIFGLLFSTRVWLDILISHKYKDIYRIHDLKSHPFFQRTSDLSYILFSKHLKDSELFCVDNLESIIKWLEVKTDEYSTLTFFNTPIVLILLTLSSSIILEYLSSQNIIIGKYILPILVFVCLVLWFGWGIYDSFRSRYKTNWKIINFLKLFAIENKV